MNGTEPSATDIAAFEEERTRAGVAGAGDFVLTVSASR
jgi:hypothetical protein